MRYTLLPTLLTTLLLLTGCDKIAPPGMGETASSDETSATPAPVSTPRPAATAPSTRPAVTPPGGSSPTEASFLGLTAPKPESWSTFPPSSGMRAANYRVPGLEGAGPAEVVVFFFGAGQGGPVQMNIDRWVGQFQAPGGGPVEPVRSEMEVDGMAVTMVELEGEYRGMGSEFKPDRRFVAAIVEAPVGRVFIRLVGPTATVKANEPAFATLVEGLRRTDGQ